MSTECNIIALVYVNRAIALSGMPLGAYNWRPVVLVSMILAQKVWDDKSLRASCFAQICPEYSKEQIKKYEIFFLRILQYSGLVTRALYTRYYFELRDLYERVNTGSLFPLKALSVSEAKRLEIISGGFKVIPKGQSKTRRSRSGRAPSGDGSVASDPGMHRGGGLSSAASVSSQGSSNSGYGSLSSWSGPSGTASSLPSSAISAPTTISSGGTGTSSSSGMSPSPNPHGYRRPRTAEDMTLTPGGRYIQS